MHLKMLHTQLPFGHSISFTVGEAELLEGLVKVSLADWDGNEHVTTMTAHDIDKMEDFGPVLAILSKNLEAKRGREAGGAATG